MSRIAKLEQMLEQDPQDVFLQYALATELLKQEDPAPAMARFDHIHREFPDYVAAWFRHAQALAEIGETDSARPIAEQGLAAARRMGDHHALSEITGFLELL